jgi:hypothetical protein
MSDINIVKNHVLDHVTITVDAEDGSPSREWKLQYDYPAIMKCEEVTKLDLVNLAKWSELCSSKHFPAVVWAGLTKNQPTLTLDDVVKVLNPAMHEELASLIFRLLHPATWEQWHKKLVGKESGATADPNS